MNTTYPNREMPVKDLQLGDLIRVSPGPFGTAIVKQVTKEIVTFFRPYGVSEEFSYTGGVICYVGMESIEVRTDSSHKFYVYERKELA